MVILFVIIWKSRSPNTDHCRIEYSRKSTLECRFLPDDRTANGAEPQQVVTYENPNPDNQY